MSEAKSPQEAFKSLVELHSRQPHLNVRSSTSVAQQAYSTPLPIAYLASVLAGVTQNTSVYEPSAGHGALLLGSNPEKVTVNELNAQRAEDLRSQGYAVTRNDATNYVPSELFDIVIMNPPFGSVEEVSGTKKQFQFGEFRTTQIDQAIALKNLRAMKPDGRAVLILGSKLGNTQDIRSDKYNTRESRGFYWTLYNRYNVTNHFTIDGNLYRKQGAGFPIDVIVIEGRGKSARPLPARDVPPIYYNFDELRKLVDDALLSKSEYMVSKGGRTDSNSISSNGRDAPEQESLPRTSGDSVDLASRAVDKGGINRTNLPDAQKSHHRVDDSASNKNDTNLPNVHNNQGVDEKLDEISDFRERHHAKTSRISQSIISSPSDDGRKTKSEAIVDVSRIRPATESGRVAAGSNQSIPPVEEQPRQLPYKPKSTAKAIGTLVPANMQAGVNQALTKLERQVGNLDNYVADRLAYGSTQEVHKYFSAEQVDAIALAVSNLEKGSGFILGDQTGIGKGRVVAGVIRYAKVTGRTPIFVTKDDPLYADMIRDLRDIGMPNFKPLVTKEGLSLPLPDGRVLKTDSKNHRKVMESLKEKGDLRGYDAIFTTYSQMQTVKGGQETERRAFLKQFAPQSIIILDESHEAGGSTGKTGKKDAAAPNRADFTRQLIELSQGVMYSSATYAKDPQVMDLYSRTDMRLALSNMASLTELVSTGGVPLQQTLASMLTESGQYIRRERSFEGVQFEPAIAPVNRDVAENISKIMSEIMEFDRLKQKVIIGMDGELKAEAKAAYGDNSTGGAGASSTNFTSIMHNVIDQMLFALKAEEAIQKTLELLRHEQPQKPVIALSNTMGSLIAREAEEQQLHPGEEIDMNFGSLLHRYLDRSRDVIIGNPYGEKSRRRLSDEELGIAATTKYHAIRDLINETDFSDIPASPIDYITFRLNQEGYRVGEVTGREHIAVYNADGTTTYQRRTNQERSKASAVRTVKSFNDGQIDVIILNSSGSTGISLHASEKFPDQRQRHMVVVQAESDINQFMQMLGRVHRTGQVVPPNFTLLMADIPAEKRPGAVLAKKMASLNANTTAARSSAFSLRETADFMNEYGDIVVTELMKAYPELHQKLDSPLENSDGTLSPENATRRVTGRIPLLPIDEQEMLYNKIESKYNEFVATQEAMKESILEASTLNLDARTLARMEVMPADATSDSPFTGAVYAEICDVKAPRKPYPTLHIINKLQQTLNLPQTTETSSDVENIILQAGIEAAKEKSDRLSEQVKNYKHTISVERAYGVENQFYQVTKIIEDYPIGQTVCLTTGKNDLFYGVVADIARTGTSASPVAPSSWEIKLFLADSVRELSLSLSQVNTGKNNAVTLTVANKTPQDISIMELFDHLQTKTREKRQIFTGNLLRAWEKFPGKTINFTDANGNIRQGLLTPKGFDAETELEKMPVTMPTIEDAYRFLTEQGGQLKTGDKSLTIKPGYTSAEFLLQTPKPKDLGGKYYLDEGLLEIAEGEFYSISDRMECQIEKDKLEPMLAYLMRDKGYPLAAFEKVDAARSMLGVELPSFQDILPETTAPTEEPSQEESEVSQQTTNSAVSKPTLDDMVETDLVSTLSISLPSQQVGNPEKNIAKLLQQGGLLETIMQGEEFHLKVENEPFIPLVFERHNCQLYVTHYLSDDSDTYIDSEMVFDISSDGLLTLGETAVTSLGKEWRSVDRSFANTFSRNLLRQGFGEAIAEHLSGQKSKRAEESPSENPTAQQFLNLREDKDNDKNALDIIAPTFSPSSESELIPTPELEQLPQQLKDNRAIASESDELMLKTWLQAVHDLGLKSERNHHIQNLMDAQQSTKQITLSPYLKNIMEGDLEKYRPYQERGVQLLDTVQAVMVQAGQLDIWGRKTLKHNRYECVQKDDTLTVQIKKGNQAETILQTEGDRILSTTVKQKDLDRFTQLAQEMRLNILQQFDKHSR